MTVKQRQMLNWVGGFAILIALIISPFEWKISVCILVALVAYISWLMLSKVLMFVAYHAMIFTIAYFFILYVLGPAFNVEWHPLAEWLRIGLRATFKAILATLAVASILSCWDKKRLSETQIGQLSINGWMPIAFKNQKNSAIGLFTGLPAFLVKIHALDNTARVIKKTISIQIEIDGDSEGKKFQADFDVNFAATTVDTYLYITNPHKDEDLINVLTEALTDWTNDSAHKYKDVKALKIDKNDIETHLGEAMAPVEGRYGDQISNFNLVDIQEPAAQIKQQIDDASAARAQAALDAREKVDTAALNDQIQMVIDKSKEVDPTKPLSYKEAQAIVMTQRGIIQKKILTGRGAGRTILDI